MWKRSQTILRFVILRKIVVSTSPDSHLKFQDTNILCCKRKKPPLLRQKWVFCNKLRCLQYKSDWNESMEWLVRGTQACCVFLCVHSSSRIIYITWIMQNLRTKILYSVKNYMHWQTIFPIFKQMVYTQDFYKDREEI